MNCSEARLRIGAEPNGMSDALAEHLRSCDSCRDFRRETIALDGDIRRALEAPVGVAAASPRRSIRALRFRRHWALAASLLIALFVGAAFWAVLPAESLAREVVAHVAHEPASWNSANRLSQADLDQVLDDVGVSLDAQEHHVTYARECPFRGRSVPHLVLRSSGGPVTVLVLRGERVRSTQRFGEEGYSGVLLPTAQGSLAVLARDPVDLEAAARDVQDAMRPH